ncbi:MAG: YqgE/AlgH family protein [Holosporaceae bacterium]|jgi:putative transcriptional regulator|nr:YqgE/AlgH family protein [Holosporaceae bacterium]
MCINNNDIRDLTGKVLLSTLPDTRDYLSKSMVYLCSHDKNGAMGIIINKLIPSIDVRSLLKNLKVRTQDLERLDIHFGGIEEIDRCFILHSDDYMSSSSVIIKNHVALTVNDDILKVITSNGGPSKKIICMGCCIWDADQLENEVASSHWIPVDQDEALIFGDTRADKWSKALLKIGSKTNMFSDIQGNA